MEEGQRAELTVVEVGGGGGFIRRRETFKVPRLIHCVSVRAARSVSGGIS